ncbi:YceI family protein [Aureivirga sp. CE67]|uniref:YceI family protein n=1 Tax=Aureivirga sp. CE67 TaxID=1788983 RepID=UPI0018C9650A|nr:YceI family protein [Aureivirga sp. CE67]
MKKRILIGCLFAATLTSFVACKNEVTKKVEGENTEQREESNVQLDPSKTKITWTAYKTTEKKPVSGTFKEITISNNNKATNVREALNGAHFSIPVSSIYSKDSIRDSKLQKFFFNVMENTELLSGDITVENDSMGYIALKMNGMSEKLPFHYVAENKDNAELHATLDLNKWNAQAAVEALNKACFDLHKGADGVSKTWSEVTIKASTSIK